ncbi:MATE family efflux transporter [Clostridium sp. D2Q-14]|uniref:MATE family efflux transporter n=1 Tax=Anaeromonas gelatinilytica TaxID=2683194 RepID=UPI00193B1961|nr:MATE family efflux transporter [Anaeromonas gelatinilytica]MBS4534036.1 MATE family efflux transporter [Anaeromonas gelatinilytica]
MPKAQLKNNGIDKEFAGYAIPAVIGMVVSSLYNIVDGIFVGRGVGKMALGAINIIYPFIMLEIAITMLIAIGGANHFSANRGRGDDKAANNIFLQSIYLMIAIGVILNVLVLLFTPMVCRMLGADDALLPYAQDYIWWIALFGIVYMPGLGLSIFVRNDNAPRRELVGTLSGTVVNIVLDYLFIMVFDMGLTGAAIATGIGQTVSVLIFMTHFFKKKRVLRFAKARWRCKDIKKILFSGTPSFLMEFSQSAVAFSFNLVLMARVGAGGVSYYSIVMYICSMFNMVLIGLMQGAQPIMSFNHGGGNMITVKVLRSLAIKTAIILTTIIYGGIFFFGGTLASIFVPDSPELTSMAANMMKYYFLAFFPIGITLMNILYFQVTEQSTQSILLSFLRCIGFIQLFLLVLPSVFGTIGIYLSFLCGEMCHFLLSALFLKTSKKEKALKLSVGKTAITEKSN